MTNHTEFFSYDHIVDLGFEFFLHGTILFIVLTVFYLTVAKQAETSSIQGQAYMFSARIAAAIYNNINSQSSGKSNQYIIENGEKLTKLKKFYENPSNELKTTNEMISSNMIFMSIILVCITSIYYLIFKKNIQAKGIIMQTIIIFIFVGMIELLFFMTVALNYAPGDVAFLLNEIKKDVRENPILNN